ncbi:hypothetical protein MPSEU_000633400 [Mayamaea pseudoterrestris]|nr:hypothetical protein MPSEU_000633400 [Mayamaea pseudoterrestris]
MEDADQAKDAPTDAFTVTYDCQGDLCQASTNTTTIDSNVAAEIVSANNDSDDLGAGTESTNHRAGNGGAGGIRNTTDDMAPLPDVLEQQLEALMPPNQVLTIMNPEIIGNNGSNDNNYEAHGDDEVAMPDATMRSYGMIFGLAVCSVTSGLIYLTQKRRDNFFAKDEPQSNKVVNDPTYTASDYCDSRVVAYPFATMAQDITEDVTICSLKDPDRGAQDTLESTLEPVILNEAAPDSALAPKQEKQVSKDAIDSVVPPKNGSLGVATSVTPPVTYIMPRPEEAMYHIEEVFDVSGTNLLEKDGDNVVVEFSIDEDDGALQTSPVFEFTARSLVDVNFDSNGNDRSAIASDNEDGMVEHLNENEDARQALALINLTVVNDNNGAEAPTSLDMSIVVDPAAANGICFNGTMPLASGTGFAMKTPTNTALPLSMAALYLVYKGYKMCCRNTVNSYDLCELMQYWRETLERSGRPCRTGKFGGGVFRYDPSNYETLTKGDLHQVLKEGFHYAARSDSKKYDLICKLCSKYEAALNAMTKAGIREVLEVNGVDAPDRIKKDDLVLLALEVGF